MPTPSAAVVSDKKYRGPIEGDAVMRCHPAGGGDSLHSHVAPSSLTRTNAPRPPELKAAPETSGGAEPAASSALQSTPSQCQTCRTSVPGGPNEPTSTT